MSAIERVSEVGPMHVVWLGDSACHDPSLVGGKAANLSRLTGEYRAVLSSGSGAHDPLGRRETLQ